ncbi:PH domain-containing protein [Pseudoalteromonas tunicata]|jgi:membrane protein YdbS with pleckstrin-like domain|uniref:YdbS-like PH domain-containing protein n=1 Tax=Pseudoalteromonas tunicata D2 TaxID=87626 RepID=A4CDT1_9GAMM|nr:PH domain-containing protein [Pseudoalteromonas tunicata]ATC96385.1 hypothetical protein PTUN_a4174 [Pseudoalteromonas tunicata]AXT31879.1 hypothetical protein D1819_14345 [Pseudoalteromonas tunicata]EAR27123.1 putative unknown membrane associated protein [Pseudoalteromonas tunicata D2]
MFSNCPISIAQLPDIEQVEFAPLDHHATTEARLSTFLFLLPFSLLVGIGLFFLQKVSVEVAIGLSSLLIMINLYVFWFVGLAVKRTGIALREHDFLLKKGVFWQKVIIVPFNRVQHIETHRNPIERKLALSSLKLFTAGGMGADLEINGLNIERASQIRQFILKQEHADE